MFQTTNQITYVATSSAYSWTCYDLVPSKMLGKSMSSTMTCQAILETPKLETILHEPCWQSYILMTYQQSASMFKGPRVDVTV